MSETLTPGDFLVAGPSLVDPNFRRSVVLMCEHDEEGSMGLIVNRPLQVSLDQIFPEIAADVGELPTQPGSVVFGGPVESGRVLAIRDTRSAPPVPGLDDANIAILDGVSLVGEIREAIAAIARNEQRPEHYRLMLGYAGWGPGQLDSELEHGSWIVRPATRRLVFGTEPEKIWPTALRELGGIHRLQAEMPIDPSVN